jgi:hypothetical protein
MTDEQRDQDGAGEMIEDLEVTGEHAAEQVKGGVIRSRPGITIPQIAQGPDDPDPLSYPTDKPRGSAA